jgi:hypothetical protein
MKWILLLGLGTERTTLCRVNVLIPDLEDALPRHEESLRM